MRPSGSLNNTSRSSLTYAHSPYRYRQAHDGGPVSPLSDGVPKNHNSSQNTSTTEPPGSPAFAHQPVSRPIQVSGSAPAVHARYRRSLRSPLNSESYTNGSAFPPSPVASPNTRSPFVSAADSAFPHGGRDSPYVQRNNPYARAAPAGSSLGSGLNSPPSAYLAQSRSASLGVGGYGGGLVSQPQTGPGGNSYAPAGFAIPPALSHPHGASANMRMSPYPDGGSSHHSPLHTLSRGSPSFSSSPYPAAGSASGLMSGNGFVGSPHPPSSSPEFSQSSTSQLFRQAKGGSHVLHGGGGPQEDAMSSSGRSNSSAGSVRDDLPLCPNDDACALINDRRHQHKYAHTCRLFPCYHGHIVRHAKLFRHVAGQITKPEGVNTTKLSTQALTSVNFSAISPEAPNAYRIYVSHGHRSYELFGDWSTVKVHTFKRYLHQVYHIPPPSQVLNVQTSKKLMDDDLSTVRSYGIEADAVILLQNEAEPTDLLRVPIDDL